MYQTFPHKFYLTGTVIAAGRPSLLYMQNSGLGNAGSPIASLLHERVYGILCLFVVGWGGEPHQGVITTELLELLGIRSSILGEDPEIFSRCGALLEAGECAAIVVKKGALTQQVVVQDQLLSLPENRRSRLKELLSYKPCLSVLEAHNGLAGLIVENRKVEGAHGVRQFDAMGVSSLCDSTAKGKPDIELVDMTSRIKTLEEIMEMTTKPIILDGDTGGLTEHFVFNIRTLEHIGVSAVIIEDKQGLKKNSLFGTTVEQTQDTVENFCEKLRAGKEALKTKDFLIFARCESLILEREMEDALARCFAYVKAGADGIMIHSRQKGPEEILAFCRQFRAVERDVPLVVVPTTFNTVTEEEFARTWVNIVIHANHMLRSAFPAMQRCAEMILEHGRSCEADSLCMPISQILTLIQDA